MRVLVAIFFFLFFCVVGVKANSSTITWYSGSVVLANQEVYVGELYIQNQFDLLLIRDDSKVKVFPAHKVHSIYFYDSIENINRRFVSIEERQEAFTSFRLYEVVLKGKVSVLRREKRFSDNQLEEYNANGFRYYVQWKDSITDLKRFRSDIYPTLLEYSKPAISAFIREHKLNSNLDSDAIQIIDYYNHLANDQVIASR